MKIELKRILCPVDFSASSEHAMDYAITLAETFEAELLLLHVVEPPVYGVGGDYLDPDFSVELTRRQEDACRAHMTEALRKAKAQYGRVDTRLVTGAPFVGIVETARKENSDLIVMGTHGRTGLAHMLIGSVAEKVVRKAACPVLTVKHPEHEFVMP